MSTPLLLSDADKIQGARNALPKNKSFPSRAVHLSRRLYNIVPDGELKYISPHPTKRWYHIYKDLSDREWIRKPWYLNVFHKPWKQSKLVHYDIHTDVSALGSSEVQINRKTREIINEGSYNYRDFELCGHFRHFLADLLPVVLYLHK